jgi:hypothetical protein
MVDEQLYVPARAVGPAIRDDEARVNVTWAGQNGDLPDPVARDATDGDIKTWATEAIRGGIPGIDADPGADLTDFVVDRFDPKPEDGIDYARIAIRPKTPFGG